MHKQSWEQSPESQTPMWMLEPVGKTDMLPDMYLLSSPLIQQHFAAVSAADPQQRAG